MRSQPCYLPKRLFLFKSNLLLLKKCSYIGIFPTIGYKFSDKWSGFSELVYRKAESQDYEYSLGSGVIYALNERTQLDASVGAVS